MKQRLQKRENNKFDMFSRMDGVIKIRIKIKIGIKDGQGGLRVLLIFWKLWEFKLRGLIFPVGLTEDEVIKEDHEMSRGGQLRIGITIWIRRIRTRLGS